MVYLDRKMALDTLILKSMRTRFILLALGILQLVARTAAQSGGGTRAAGASADEAVKLEVFTVTGSNIRRVDAETALPVTVIDKSELDARGAATMAAAPPPETPAAPPREAGPARPRPPR